MITSALWFTVGLLFIVAAGTRPNVEPFLSRAWWVDVVSGGVLAGVGFVVLSHLAIKVAP